MSQVAACHRASSDLVTVNECTSNVCCCSGCARAARSNARPLVWVSEGVNDSQSPSQTKGCRLRRVSGFIPWLAASFSQCFTIRTTVPFDFGPPAGAAGFAPIALLDAHTSKISSLASCVFEWTPAIASCSADGASPPPCVPAVAARREPDPPIVALAFGLVSGAMCLWDPEDGRCLLRHPTALPGEATHCQMLPTSRELAVCGHFPGIRILEGSTLNAVTCLGAERGWFRGLRPYSLRQGRCHATGNPHLALTLTRCQGPISSLWLNRGICSPGLSARGRRRSPPPPSR